MPLYGDYSDAATPDLSTVGPVSASTIQQGIDTTSPVDSGNPIVNTLGMGLAAIPDLADTLATNKLVSGFTGVQRGDVNQMLYQGAANVGLPGMQDFYQQHREGIEAMSGIGGLVASEILARKITAPAGAAMGLIRTLPFARRVATLDEEYQNARAVVQAGDKLLAARGATGVEAYTGKLTVDGLAFDSKLGAFTDTTFETTRSAALFKAKGLAALTGVRNAAATEAVAFSALNSNGFLYTDDASQNIFNQALGLAIGGAGEWLHAGYQARKFANSDVVKRAFSDAYDPNGIESGRLDWRSKTGQALPEDQTFFGGSYTDRLTSFKVQSSQLSNAPVEGADAATLLANRKRFATEADNLANQELAKVTTKGFFTDGRSRFGPPVKGAGANGAWNHLTYLLANDPTGLYGVEQIGHLTSEMGDAVAVHQTRVNRLNELIDQTEEALADPRLKPSDSSELQRFRRRLDADISLTPSAVVDFERMPLSEAASIQGFVEPKILFEADQAPSLFGKNASDSTGLFTAKTVEGTNPVSMDTGLTLHMKGDFATTADHFSVIRAYRVADQVVDKLASWRGPIQLPANPNFLHLDMMEQVLKRNPTANIVWPAGMTAESAQVESFAQKAEAMQWWMAKQSREISEGADPAALNAKLRVRLNLPRQTAYEIGLTGNYDSPVESLLRGAAKFGPQEIRKMSLAELKQSTAEVKRLGDMVSRTAQDVDSLAGNSFKFMKDPEGNPVAPLIVYSRPYKTLEWSPDDLADRLAARKLNVVDQLTNKDADPYTQLITASAMKNPDLATAMNTSGLIDTQIQASAVGMAPQTMGGAIGTSIRGADWTARDTPELLAPLRLRRTQEALAQNATRDIINGTFGDSLNQLKNPRNQASKLLLDRFYSHSAGWDLESKVVPKGAGGRDFGFTLSDTVENRQRWQMLGRGQLPKGQPLLGPKGNEIILDQLGMDLHNRYQTVNRVLVNAQNTGLRANGLPEFSPRNHYTPPPGLKGKYVGYVIGPDGRTTPGLSVVASTPGEFGRLRDALAPELERLGAGYSFYTEDEIKNHASIWGRAQMDFIDPNLTAAKPGRTDRGALTGQQINMNAFHDALQTLRDGFFQHEKDITSLLLKEQIDATRARASMASSMTAHSSNSFNQTRYRNIYDMWLENATGKTKLDSLASPVGLIWNSVEGSMDKALAAATPLMGRAGAVWTAANAWMGRANPWRSGPAATNDFETLSQALGSYMPFNTAADLVAAKTGSANPITSKQLASQMSQFTAAVTLRVMEVGQPIMNLAGLINAMPAVIRHYSWQDGDTVESLAARTGHSATIFQVPGGKPVSIVDMSKLAAAAFKEAWNPATSDKWAYRVQHGYVGNQIAEFHRQMSTIESRGKWEKVFLGDHTITNPKTQQEAIASKGVVGMLSLLSDTSEDFSRSYAHVLGANLAKHLGITDLDAAESFGHDIANKMIANYSPHNRPEIYQGAVGTTLGLFQSFIREYYQRLFRYVETKDYGSLGLQMGMQGALFGVNTMPGWAEWNAAMAATGHGGDPSSGIHHKFGQSAGDLISNGVISNLPTLFGAPGVNLYSRGDTNIQLPGTVVPPAINVAMKVMGGIGKAIKAFTVDHAELTHTELTEIVSNAIVNRPLAGLIQAYGDNGDETDAKGQLVSTVKNSFEQAYRLIGLRSERQSNEINAFYANKNAQTHQAAAMDVLRVATRAALREGNTDIIPHLFTKYVDNGGDPARFQNWIKDNYVAASQTRGTRQLREVLASPAKMALAQRLLDAGVTIDADKKTPDLTAKYGGLSPEDQFSQPQGGLGDYSGQATIEPDPAASKAEPSF